MFCALAHLILTLICEADTVSPFHSWEDRGRSPGWVALQSLRHSLSAVPLLTRPTYLEGSETLIFSCPLIILPWAEGRQIRLTHLLRFPSKGIWTQLSWKGLNLLLLQTSLCFRKNSANGAEMKKKCSSKSSNCSPRGGNKSQNEGSISGDGEEERFQTHLGVIITVIS